MSDIIGIKMLPCLRVTVRRTDLWVVMVEAGVPGIKLLQESKVGSLDAVNGKDLLAMQRPAVVFQVMGTVSKKS